MVPAPETMVLSAMEAHNHGFISEAALSRLLSRSRAA
jgi:hypothetical protein